MFSPLPSISVLILHEGIHDLRHSHLLVLFLLTVYSFSIFGFKEYYQSDFSVDHLVMSSLGSVSCLDSLIKMP